MTFILSEEDEHLLNQSTRSSLQRSAITEFVSSFCRKTFVFLHFQIFQSKQVKMVLNPGVALLQLIFQPQLLNSKGRRHRAHVNATVVPEASATRTGDKKIKEVFLSEARWALSRRFSYCSDVSGRLYSASHVAVDKCQYYSRNSKGTTTCMTLKMEMEYAQTLMKPNKSYEIIKA